MKFTLTLNGRNGFQRDALYDPTDSSLVWTDTGEPLPLPAVFPRQDRDWQPFWHAHHPTNPGGKSRDVRHLKLQLGLKCNYACQYCSQAHQPHDLDGHPSDVGPFMDQLRGGLRAAPTAAARASRSSSGVVSRLCTGSCSNR